MISPEQYFGSKTHSLEHERDADDLLVRVNALCEEASSGGVFHWAIDPDTGTEISGSRGGAGDGGLRLPTATTGRQKSSHKEARAVDVYDPQNELNDWLSEFDNAWWGNAKLEQHGLYREAPGATPTWVHLSTREPGSGRRTFNP